MSLVERLRNETLTARRNRDERLSRLLVTLLSDVDMIGKNEAREAGDKDVLTVVRKFLKGVNDTLSVRPEDASALFELEVLNGFLPAQMTDDDLSEFVKNVVAGIPEAQRGPKSMGVVMGRLKAEREGQYDGKRANEIIKAVLAG